MYYKGELEIANYLSKSQVALFEEDLAKALNLNLDSVRRACESLKEKACIREVVSKNIEKFKPTEEFKNLLIPPELELYNKVKSNPNGVKIQELSDIQKTLGIGLAKKKGLIKIENGFVKANEGKEAIANSIIKDFNNLKSIYKLVNFEPIQVGQIIPLKDGEHVVIFPKGIPEEYVSRKWLIKSVEKGRSFEFIKMPSESEFSISPVQDAEFGKGHPLTLMAKKIKTIFVEMGFEEMSGDIIESSFWNFDALFQPQDHPARELADTFYLDRSSELPDKSLVKKVKEAHEKGWKYNWKESEAKRSLLRTHTTAVSARYLANMKSTPKKFFSVGRVFRNEATDYKHLAEFHQVEGIVAWENAKFTDLLGILKEFYSRLGFEKIRFRPSFFPYTEPSLEIEVYFEPRKQWMELGGAGILRPEVSKTISNVYPVLAWGLSLERPLMLSMGLEDIRTFYKNDLDWLKKAKI